MNIFQPISRYLDTNGDGTGTKNAVGDYSVGTTDFYIEPPGPDKFVLSRLLIQIEDARTGGWDADGYGQISAPGLTNGISALLLSDTGSIACDLTDNTPIKSNVGWGQLCYDTVLHDFGNGNFFLSIRWTLAALGHPIELDPGERFVIRLSDDFTALVAHYFLIQGFSG